MVDLSQFMYEGESLYGDCSHCERRVDNYDYRHRVTSILRGGRGVECVLRGDIERHEAGPLARPSRVGDHHGKEANQSG